MTLVALGLFAAVVTCLTWLSRRTGVATNGCCAPADPDHDLRMRAAAGDTAGNETAQAPADRSGIDEGPGRTAGVSTSRLATGEARTVGGAVPVELRLEGQDRHLWLTATATVGVLVALGLFSFGLPPVDLHPPTHRLGIMDPLCGGTRSAWLTLHGRLGDAWTYNPLGIAAVLSAALVTARTTLGLLGRRWVNLWIRWSPRGRFAVITIVVIGAALLEWRQQGRADLLLSRSTP